MNDWTTWHAALDLVAKLGVGGIVGGIAGWFLKRWVGSRDSAVARGRERVEQARPEVVPSPGTTLWENDHRVTVRLVNRGRGAARDIQVTFTGSAACGRVPEIEAGRHADTPEMRLGDAPLFHRKLDEQAEITVRFWDRYEHEYVVVLPVDQEDHGNNRFTPRWVWGQHRVTTEPQPTQKRLRELGGR